MKLDRRTRRDADLQVIGLEDFFSEQFAHYPDERKELAANGIRHLGAPDLSIRIGNTEWTVRADRTLIATRTAASHSVLVELDAAHFSDWAQQQTTFSGLVTGHNITILRGSKRDLAAWDAAWLALLEGWPVVDSDLRFIGRDGEELNLGRVFTPHDADEDIAHFLREAGYLHLRGWLKPELMVRIGHEIDAALPSYRDGDGNSWWVTIDGGDRKCVRLQNFVEHSPTTHSLLASQRWDSVRRAISGRDDIRQGPMNGNCIEALVKPLGVIEGVSDVPWHRDCNFGRHAYQCAGIVAGISVDPGDLESGCLRVVAGSHRVCMPAYRAGLASYLPVITVTTERGDITVHQTCTLHEATPPLVRPRRVMYTGFGLPPTTGISPDHARQRAIKDLRERAHLLQSQPRSPLARAGQPLPSTHA
jgi:Phytanoyl-CoA dioxygenase (PhyH)